MVAGLFGNIALGGNISSNLGTFEGGVNLPAWTLDVIEEGELEPRGDRQKINAAQDFNDCMKVIAEKNDRDHDRCKGNRACDKKADDNYQKNRDACERVSHSDNLRQAGVSWGKPANGNNSENKTN